MSKLLMKDRDTIMNFNDKELFATVYTCNTQMIERLKQMLIDFPEDVKLIEETKVSIKVTMPKNWLKISTPRRLTDAQRQAAAERMMKNRAHKK